MSKKILFVGGGSLGHIVPSFAVLEAMRRLEPSVSATFVCCPRDDETHFLREKETRAVTLNAPKFPRGLSLLLLTFPFLFITAFFKSFSILKKEKPSIIFSKGGFLSVPFCMAASIKHIPIVLHSSDSVPSLSDKVVGKRAVKIFTGFPFDRFPDKLKSKCVLTGNPVRSDILLGTKGAGIAFTKFSGKRPIILMVGGSQGAQMINEEVERSFDELLSLADIVHITGIGKKIPKRHARYFARELVLQEFPALLALADVVVTRAGAGALAELAVLGKPTIVLPLEGVAHNHQVHNAGALVHKEAAIMLREPQMKELVPTLKRLLENSAELARLSAAIKTAMPSGASERIAKATLDACKASA